MAIKVPPLTAARIRQAKPADKEYNLSDGGGLQLRVKPTGTRVWLFNYRKPFTGTRTNIALGQYPGTSLAAARQRRLECLALLEQDTDPKSHREEIQRIQKEAHSNTLKKVANDWLSIKREKVTPGHAADIQRSLELHVFPRLGNHPVTRLTARETIDVLKPIGARGSLETVKRLCQRLNEIMDYGVNTGLLEHNPLAGIGKAFAPPGKAHMPTLKPDQLPDLMGDLNSASIRVTTRCLIEWQLHTMVRPSEAAGARWDEIDIKRALWHIPAERMKKKRPHTVPLSSQALALLEHVRPISGHLEYVFPADRNPRKHTHQQTANAALKRIGYGGRLVAHGLRSMASTTLNEQGFDPEIIEAALAHVDSNDVRAAYNRAEYIERRRSMMAWWSDHIEAAAQGSLSVTGFRHLRAVQVN
ncbi:MAG: integrase domain-containing protein [Pseudomonadota bacterium]